jgi:predicted short-subunit dehydrogenase-like oxidoreductase (DUF2520 family)
LTLAQRTISLVGAGAAGTALLLALHRQGYVVVGVASRRIASARRCARWFACMTTEQAHLVAVAAQLVIIATPDEMIREVCEQIARQGGFRPGQVVLHLSGALASDALQAAREAGAAVMAMHPVQTFSGDPEQGAQSLSGAYFGLQGDAEALVVGHRLVAALSGHAVVIAEHDKPLYHAALCVAANYLVGLADVAVCMLERAGVEKDTALPLLLPLMQGALNNLQHVGLPHALTGPISRGDAATVAGHLQALQQQMPELLDVYRDFGRQVQQLAVRNGRQNPPGRKALDDLLRAPDV